MKRWFAFVFPIVMIIGLVTSAFVILAALNFVPIVPDAGAVTQDIAPVQPVDTVAQGKELFVAKGCIVCHRNDRVTNTRSGALDFSDVPNLTSVNLDRDYLRRWLHDPAVLKPGTAMPNLGLSDEEIESLVVFLTLDTK